MLFVILGLASLSFVPFSRKLRSVFRGMCILTIWLSLIAAAAFAIWGSDWQYIKVFVGPIVVGLIGHNWVMRQTKNEDAENILCAVLDAFANFARQTGIKMPEMLDHDVPLKWDPYVLYLRPFYVDTVLDSDSGPLRPSNAFEDLLERGVEKFGNIPICALGEDKVSSGASRLQLTDKVYAKLGISWTDIAITLMKGADLIVLWPSARPGTVWETFVCLQRFLEKTIFCFPDTTSFDPKTKNILATDFASAQIVFVRNGCRAPDLVNAPMWWRYASQKELVTASDFAAIVQDMNINRLMASNTLT